MSQQTINLSSSLPLLAESYNAADTGTWRWKICRSYKSSRKEIGAKDFKAIEKFGAISLSAFSSRTEALRFSANIAKQLASAAGFVAEEKIEGAWGCWRTADEQGKKCFQLVFPFAPSKEEIAAQLASKASKPASKPAETDEARLARIKAEMKELEAKLAKSAAKPSNKAAQASKPADKAVSETSAQRREREALEAKQKQDRDLQAAQAKQAEAQAKADMQAEAQG